MAPRRPPSAPARRRRRFVLNGLAVLGLALASLVVRPSLEAAARSRPSADSSPSTTQAAPAAPPRRPPAPARASSVLDERSPTVAKLDPDLLDALRRSATDAAADGVSFRVNSGWRSPEHQAQLLADAVKKYGSLAKAKRWVATPGTSLHVSGDAVDMGASSAAWLARHGAAYGLCQIYRNEPWHYELRPRAVADGCPPTYADATEDPRLQASSPAHRSAQTA